jgi:hypothetical protein
MFLINKLKARSPKGERQFPRMLLNCKLVLNTRSLPSNFRRSVSVCSLLTFQLPIPISSKTWTAAKLTFQLTIYFKSEFFFRSNGFYFDSKWAPCYNVKCVPISNTHFWFKLHSVTKGESFKLLLIEWILGLGLGVWGNSSHHAGCVAPLNCQADPLNEPGRLPRFAHGWAESA